MRSRFPNHSSSSGKHFLDFESFRLRALGESHAPSVYGRFFRAVFPVTLGQTFVGLRVFPSEGTRGVARTLGLWPIFQSCLPSHFRANFCWTSSLSLWEDSGCRTHPRFYPIFQSCLPSYSREITWIPHTPVPSTIILLSLYHISCKFFKFGAVGGWSNFMLCWW